MHQSGNLYHPNEDKRIETLHGLRILDTPVEQRFEHITALLREIFQVPISTLSFVDLHRQWFKSIQGERVEQTRRCISFCQHTILQDDVMVIPDARFDERFGHSPLVTEDPGVVFYAGAPVHGPNGLPVASLCIIDRVPRSLDEREKTVLKRLARVTESLLRTPRANAVEDLMIQHTPGGSAQNMIDPLTRTWNGRGIQMLAQSTLQRARHTSEQVGLAMINLDGLGQLSESMNAPKLDQLVFDFSRVAMGAIEPHDTIGRLRNAEFALVMTRVRGEDDLRARIEALSSAAEELRDRWEEGSAPVEAHVCATIADPEHPDGAYRKLAAIEDAIESMRGQPAQAPMILPTIEAGTDQTRAA